MALQLRCPKCRKAFPWDGKDFPERCLVCKEVVNEKLGSNRSDDDIVMPFVRANSSIAKTVDKLYRDTERGSEVRAELAAEAAGASVAEMSSLKITNMADNQRPGDIAAPPIPDIGQKFVGGGSEYSAGVSSGAISLNGQVTHGIEPRAGLRAMSKVQGIMGKSL